MKKNNKRRQVKSTLVFIGEGFAEKAFLLHIRSIYAAGDLRVTPKSAGGKGPDNVISDALGTLANTRCDSVVALLDTDIPWPRVLVEQAKKKNILLIGSTPCLEGLLIKILYPKMRVPEHSDRCKKVIHIKLDGKETCKDSYKSIFTKEVLDEASERVPELASIITVISGKKVPCKH